MNPKVAYIGNEMHQSWAMNLTTLLQREWVVLDTQPTDLEVYAEEIGIDIYVFSVQNARRPLQQVLNACRDLRVPYIILTNTMQPKPMQQLLCPVTRLEEEVYKAEIIKHLVTYTGAKVTLLQAHDYGSAAKRNTNKIVTALQHFEIASDVQIAQKDSDNLYREVASMEGHDLLLLTASRDYGLDDLLFGPQERYVLQKSRVPVMLINPREDLFSLCD